MDIRSRTKIAFVVERYALDEAGEAGRRTRAMATSLAARGHDVTVLTTCAREPDRWVNGCGDGKTSLENIKVVRFRLTEVGKAWLERPAKLLAPHSTAAVRAWARSHGPVCAGYRRYLEHLGYMFDAVFFTGAWGYLITEGLGRVRNAVLCPPPIEDPTRRVGHAESMYRVARAVAIATPEEKVRLREETQRTWPCPTYLTGASADPVPALSLRMKRMRLVDGPYLLHVGHDGSSTAKLVEAFRFFREAHAGTALTDDTGNRMSVRDVRLVLAGDHRFPHAPEDGILSLGPVDGDAHSVLLHNALAVVHADRDNRLPTALLAAWSVERPTLVHAGCHALSPVLDHVGSEYVYESPPTFAASAASLLSSRRPRRVFAARASELARRSFSTSRLAGNLEQCIRGVLGRAKGQVVPLDPTV